jgi:hypothetical protein
MKLIQKFQILTILLATTASLLATEITHVIVDPCILFPVNESNAAKFVNKWAATKYTMYKGHFPSKKDFFTALEFVPSKYKNRTYTDNLKMPAIFTDWLCGNGSNTHIKNTIIKAMQNSSKLADCEVQVYTDVLNLMMDPSTFLQTVDYNSDLGKTIQALKRNGYTIIFAANWDNENYKALKRQYGSVFSTAKETFISGEMKVVKPEQAFYDKMLRESNISADQCISIEPETQFVSGAQKVGIKAIKASSNLQAQLKNAGIRI